MQSPIAPAQILENAFERAKANLKTPFIDDDEISKKTEFVCQYPTNRAGVRLLLSVCLAKIHNPAIDIRKPYTELGENAYSGRYYDESYVTAFINMHQLPCNPTTAFLTPAFRTKPIILAPGSLLGGRPKQLYDYVTELVDFVEKNRISAENLLTESIRYLLILQLERQQRMSSLLGELQKIAGEIPLSSENIVSLVEQHLELPGSSRLPVLIVAAAYQSASQYLGKRVLPLALHNAADERTGALGDLEITLINDDQIITSYEMKLRSVTKEDIDRALQKVLNSGLRIDNYIFITTVAVESSVGEYAQELYRETGGIEFVILDCINFLRHFLHLFHRLRIQFLDIYQQRILEEPESAVQQPLKEAFLAMRRAAESSYS